MVVNTHTLFNSQEGFLANAMHQHRKNNLVKLTNYEETKKRACDSQIVRAKENFKLSYGGPSQGQTSGTNQQIKALCQVRH